MKKLLLIAFLIASMVGKAQDKIGIGNVTDGVDSVGIGSNTLWVKPSSYDPNAFIMRISVTAGQTITIPFYNTTGYNGIIDWKDGTKSTITTYNDADRVHTYAAAGDYDIEFIGTFKGFYFNNTGDKAIVKQIIQWGNVGMTSTNFAFMGCYNLFDLGDFGNSSSVTSLGASCFYDCTSLSSITIPSSVTSLGTYCFLGCTSLSSITIPSSVTSLGDYCFYRCTSLSSVTIPSSVTSLGIGCFQNCTSLSSITIPSSVTSLGNGCFYSCGSMLSYYVNPTTPPSLGSSALSGATGWKIYVPSASVAAYKAASGWSSYASRIFAQ